MLLSPEEAANQFNEQVTVEMLIRASKNCQHLFRSWLALPWPGSGDQH